VWEWDGVKNPVLTFPIKERINSELFIDRTLALRVTRISVVTNERDQRVGTADWRCKYNYHRNAIIDKKRCGIEISGVNLS